jgi:hypothetical protein
MHQLAQINIAHALHPTDAPEFRDFMDNLDRINALAEATPGFVWRLVGASGNATDLRPTDEPSLLINMSVWTSVEALFDFAYRSEHTGYLIRRREWFTRPSGAYQALWWIPAGHVPTMAEGMERIRHLDAHGPSAYAFTFKARFPAPGDAGPVTDMEPERYCGG